MAKLPKRSERPGRHSYPVDNYWFITWHTFFFALDGLLCLNQTPRRHHDELQTQVNQVDLWHYPLELKSCQCGLKFVRSTCSISLAIAGHGHHAAFLTLDGSPHGSSISGVAGRATASAAAALAASAATAASRRRFLRTRRSRLRIALRSRFLSARAAELSSPNTTKILTWKEGRKRGQDEFMMQRDTMHGRRGGERHLDYFSKSLGRVCWNSHKMLPSGRASIYCIVIKSSNTSQSWRETRMKSRIQETRKPSTETTNFVKWANKSRKVRDFDINKHGSLTQSYRQPNQMPRVQCRILISHRLLVRFIDAVLYGHHHLHGVSYMNATCNYLSSCQSFQ